MSISIKYIVFSIVGVLVPVILYTLYTIPVIAQSQNCGGGTPARAQGLVTSPLLSGKFGSTGACIANDPKVAFAPFKIPSYSDLKSTYYDQSKLIKNTINSSSLSGSFSGNSIYKTIGDLNIDSTPTGSGTQVIFVEGSLNINQNIVFHTNDGIGGLVFVIQGDVNIAKIVTQVDAVIISSSTIYTAGAGCSNLSPVTASPLTINGSLISLNEEKIIHFCRNLANNNNPAEIINAQFKYLVTLRDLMSDTLQKWSEVP